MTDYFENKLKRIFLTKETIEYVKHNVAIFLLFDISNIVASYINSESTVKKTDDILVFNILNHKLRVALKINGY